MCLCLVSVMAWCFQLFVLRSASLNRRILVLRKHRAESRSSFFTLIHMQFTHRLRQTNQAELAQRQKKHCENTEQSHVKLRESMVDLRLKALLAIARRTCWIRPPKR